MLFFSDRDTGLFLFWSSVAGLSPTRGGWFLVLKMTTLLAGATYHYLKKDVLTKMFHNLKSKPIGSKSLFWNFNEKIPCSKIGLQQKRILEIQKSIIKILNHNAD